MKNRDLLVKETTDVPVNVPLNVPLNVSVKLTDTQNKILKLLKTNPNQTAKELSEKIGVTDRTVKRAFAVLKTAELIEREGSDKTGHWIVKE